MNRFIIFLVLALVPGYAFGEGRCPPGQYPVGGQGVGGCAPIPGGAAAPAQQVAPIPAGTWDTRWGAIAQDAAPVEGTNLAIGVAVSQPSSGRAEQVALDECHAMGGARCKVIFSYHNQCAALAAPVVSSSKPGAGVLVAAGALKENEAKMDALRLCKGEGRGQDCGVIYSACSMSEFRSY